MFQGLQLQHEIGTLRAIAQVGRDLLPVFFGSIKTRNAKVPGTKLIVRKKMHFLLPIATHAPPDFSRMHCRICLRARASLDMTVPIGTPKVSAISWYFISSISARSSTSRNDDDSSAIAERTSSVLARWIISNSGVS